MNNSSYFQNISDFPPLFPSPLFPFHSFFLLLLQAWIRTRGVYLGWGSSSKTCVSTPVTGQVLQGLHREMLRGLINAHYEELEENVVCVWIDA